MLCGVVHILSKASTLGGSRLEVCDLGGAPLARRYYARKERPYRCPVQ